MWAAFLRIDFDAQLQAGCPPHALTFCLEGALVQARLGGDFPESWMVHRLQRKKMIDAARKGAWDGPPLSNRSQSLFAPHSWCPILFRVPCGKGGHKPPGLAPIAFLLTGSLKADNINQDSIISKIISGL
jgi:hypothetical protein